MNVPLELLSSILKEVESKADLLALRTACKVLHSITTPRAFRVLDVSRKHGSANAVEAIFGVSELAQHIQEIVLYADNGRHELADSDNEGAHSSIRAEPEEGEESVKDTASIFSQLSTLPNIQALRFYFPNGYDDMTPGIEDEEPSVARQLQVAIFDTLANASPIPSLKTLEIYNLICLPTESIQSPGFAAFLQPLESVHLQVVLSSEENYYYSEPLLEFYDHDVPRFLEASQVNLTSLTLSSNVLNPGPIKAVWNNNTLPNMRYFWNDVTLPNLRYLHLVRFAFYREVINPTPGGFTNLEWLVLRHAATLRSLKLTKCTIDNKPDPMRSWKDVLSNFRECLTGLREFVLEPLPGRNEKDQDRYNGYSWLLIESGYVDMFEEDADLPPEDEDIAAYDALQETIRDRLA